MMSWHEVTNSIRLPQLLALIWFIIWTLFDTWWAGHEHMSSTHHAPMDFCVSESVKSIYSWAYYHPFILVTELVPRHKLPWSQTCWLAACIANFDGSRVQVLLDATRFLLSNQSKFPHTLQPHIIPTNYTHTKEYNLAIKQAWTTPGRSSTNSTHQISWFNYNYDLHHVDD